MKLIVDDSEIACAPLKSMLVACGEAENDLLIENYPRKARELIASTDFDLVFLDVEMPRMTGMELLKVIRSDGYAGHVIFSTSHEKYSIDALRAEALDYLLKPVMHVELKDALDRFYSKRKAYDQNFDVLLDHGLTKRQVEIARRIFQGKTSAQIADELFLSKHTVDTHRRNMLKQTGCKSTTELFRLL
ncbi:MAG TPA: response regulator transcription factor [Cryomorphaceae bacterium]|nr:response regulator transcription factor [Cryomorphaceae bacterium]